MIRLRNVKGVAVSLLLAGLLVVVSAMVLTKVALAIFFTPGSIDTTGLVTPAFESAVAVITNEYDAFGVHWSDAGVDTGIFNDPPLAWGGINASGEVDLIAPVQGKIVVPGTGGVQGQTSSLSVEGGEADPGNLLLEVFDCDGSLIGSTINDDGTGPNGFTLMTLAIPGIASFRVSTPAPGGFADTFGVDSIDMEEPVPCAPPTITLDPPSDTNTVGEDHTVTATVEEDGEPLDADVEFEVTDGPNAGDTGSDSTDGNGEATFTYTGDGGAGTDTIEACVVDFPELCTTATKTWVVEPTPTPTPTVAAATATPTPTPVVLVAALPATGGTPSDGGSGALPWLALAIGTLIVTSGGLALAYQRRRVR